MEHTSAFLGRLLDVIDGEIVPKTNAALQVRAITWGDKPIASYSLYFFMTRAGTPSRDPSPPCGESPCWSQAGNKLFGAAIIRKADLSLVVADTNKEMEWPLLHGEVSCLRQVGPRCQAGVGSLRTDV